MSHLTYCAECGRKLRDAFFCPRCEQCTCSCRCFEAHLMAHSQRPTRQTERRLQPSAPALSRKGG